MYKVLNLKFLFLLIVLLESASASCPAQVEGHEFLGDFNQSRYFTSTERVNHNKANAAATVAGGYMASINSAEENEFLRSLISEISHIGLSDVNNEGMFEWASGETLSFDNLAVTNTNEDNFGNINFWNGEWGLDGVWTARKYLLEIECEQTPIELSDLNLTRQFHLSDLEVGTPFEVDLKFSNSSAIDVTTPFTIKTWLSIDESIDARDVLVAEEQYTLPVLRFRVESFAVGANIPSGTTPGTYRLITRIDAGMVIAEENETNNEIITVVEVRSSNPTSSCPSTTPVGYEHLGNYQSNAYYLSTERKNHSRAVDLAQAINGALVSIGSAEENEFLRSSINEIVRIGYTDTLEENSFEWVNGEPVSFHNLDEENTDQRDFANMNFWNGKWGLDGRWTARKYIVEIECTTTPNEPGPDLQVLDVTFSEPDGRPGETIGGLVRFANMGDRIASGGATTEIFLSTDQTISADDLRFFSSTWFNIGISESVGVSAPLELPADIALGDYYVIAEIDGRQQIDESNESNNILIKEFSVVGNPTDGIDLELKVSVDQPVLSPFSNYVFNVEVSNTGNITATNIIIAFGASSGFRFVDVSTSKGASAGWNYRWDEFDLAPGETAHMEITYFSLESDQPEQFFAQVNRVDQEDVDSIPDNRLASDPVLLEDDEGRVSF